MQNCLSHNLLILLLALVVCSCDSTQERRMFTLMTSDQTGIDFNNDIEESKAFNIISYEYMYNGGGVAAGDFNNDGLVDLFFSGNQVSNKLYINQGNWRFKDITKTAGVGGRNAWRTGVSLVDINADNLLDIYLCYSGPGRNEERANELYINQGGADPTFIERSSEYNLDAPGTFSTQSAFFDFDLDGDLDMFLLNHARITYSPFYNTRKLRNKRHPQYGNRLYRNDNGKFTDVSSDAGIHGSGINFGLGVSISDLNQDGWPDIYVTNDYEEQDFFYLNKHDGTFRECLKESFRHISRFGMGTDIADFNNDALPDVYVVDMLPEDSYRQKLLKGGDEFDKYNLLRDSGYHHQNMRNMLQLNVGNDKNDVPQFSEIGQLAKVAATDWSWCPLFVDFDNDGWKDLFVTNGYLRDYTNLDFLKYTFEDYKKLASQKGNSLDTVALIKQMPSTKLVNYCFVNNGDLSFRNVSDEWGMTEKAVSSGAVYADLDNDGDQDIVVNNLNGEAFLYRNSSNDRNGNRHLKVRLIGADQNTMAIGATVLVRTDSMLQVQENYATRGFQSSMLQHMIFGTGTRETLSEVVVRWSDNKVTRIQNIRSDTTIVIRCDATNQHVVSEKNLKKPIFADKSAETGADFRHRESDFVDYKKEYLLPYQLSSNGPCLAKGDINNDGYDDFFIGGAAAQSGEMYLSKKNGSFEKVVNGPWTADSPSEDTDAVLVDVDNDKDLDLFVVSGSGEFSNEQADLLQDRLYINNGEGKFSKAKGSVPIEKSNGSSVAFSDFDNDGDQDLFVSGKSLPGYFPLPAYSFLLRNDSKDGVVRFTDITPAALKKPGMINDCIWADLNNDSWMDLVVAGDFMPVSVAMNEKGKIKSLIPIGPECSGMWSALLADDLDGDGDVDVVAGNAGLNTTFSASVAQPLTIHYHDFNEDGKLDPLLSYSVQGKESVYPSRDELLEQLPALKKKFIRYSDYAKASLAEILTPDQLKKSKVLIAETLQSVVFLNDGNNSFRMNPLPTEAQFSKVTGIITDDFNKDGAKDILIAGNYFPYRVQIGRNDASSGALLLGGKNAKYTFLSFKDTGFYAAGDVRAMQMLTRHDGQYILLGINNDNIKWFKINRDEFSLYARN